MFQHTPLMLAQDGPSEAPDPPQRLPRESVSEGTAPAGTKEAPPQDGRPVGPGGSGFQTFLPFILIIVVFWVIMMGGQRREKKKRAKMLAAVAKGDKVQTVGGVIATVVEVRDTEVVLKVDENANIRMKFSRAAIQSVLEEKDRDAI